MADKVHCPTCGRKVSAQLRIYVNAHGFKATALGQKCRTCGTVYKAAPMDLNEAQAILLSRVPA